MSGELEQRVVELEMRLAFQDQLLSELNEALTALRLETAGQTEQPGAAPQD